MKKIVVVACSALAITFACPALFAATHTSASKMPAASSKPCKAVRAACAAAGYKKGDKNGKNLMKDCMKPLMMGEQVEGVTVDPAAMKACTTKMHKKRATMKKNMHQKAAAMPADANTADTSAAAPAPTTDADQSSSN